MFQVLRRAQLSPLTFSWEVYAPDIANAARPGQFVMVRLREGGERIPLTLADFDPRRGTVTLVVQALGRSTLEMMQAFRVGDWFPDLVGPLGVESPLGQARHIAFVGGGLGVAPLFPQLRAAKQAGRRVTALLGFRDQQAVFWQERFAEALAGDPLILCTEDGSLGRAGRVTEALAGLLLAPEVDRPDQVVAIGPMAMMQAVAELTRPLAIPTMASLNVLMVDGTGMCGSCRVTLGQGARAQVRFACVDGPDFDAHQVDFPELLRRQRRFHGEEARASQDYAHVCQLQQQLIDEGRRNVHKLKELAPTATPMAERDPAQRATDFGEVNLGYDWDQALAEADRCLQCSKPACISGCPVGVDVPGFLRKLLVRDLDGALAVIQQDNLFPSVCGRVCPQESQCEAQCIVGRKLEPVAIGRLERFVGDHAPIPRRRPPTPDPTLGRVAIVGSGPAGLACAGDLAQAGVEVTVFEALHVSGGVLRYGIPAFRLPRPIIDREIDALRALGVRFELDVVIGQTFTLAQLLGAQAQGGRGFAAAFVGTGAGFPSFLGLPGEGAGQVMSANEFLTRVNLMGGDRFPYQDTPVGKPRSVVVIGAGNTAMDCLRVARRLGAAEVRCVYRRSEAEAPARREEQRHAREEGVAFHWLRAPVEILLDAQGDVAGLRTQVMRLGEPDADGRRRPEPEPGQEELFACDMVIYALGTRANPLVPRASPGLGLDPRGHIQADPRTQATNLPGVFAGGDIVTGGATVILALGAGRRAAKAILAWLRDPSRWPPAPIEEALASPIGEGLCPRCHRPTEGGEDYVCCAGEALRYRCLDCHKRAEAQAFPYGLCPLCGGRLVLETEPDSPPPEALHQTLRRAFEIELGGAAFYAQGAAGAADPELAALFTRLAAMEQEHLATLSRRYHLPAPSPEGLVLPALFEGGALPTAPEALLRLALRLEERARDSFATQARALEEGSPAWRLCRELEAEEAEHVALIEDELRRWRDLAPARGDPPSRPTAPSARPG